jgi:hypothetical protein
VNITKAELAKSWYLQLTTHNIFNLAETLFHSLKRANTKLLIARELPLQETPVQPRLQQPSENADPDEWEAAWAVNEASASCSEACRRQGRKYQDIFSFII